MRAVKKPISTGVQARGEAFVKTVLDATLSQLADVGFERLSIPLIAELAGVNKTSIYRRWPEKVDLVRAALEGAMSHVEHAPDTGNLRGDLVELARTAATFMQSPVGMAMVRIMMAEGANPQLRALATMTYAEAGKQGPWIVLKRAVERGELNGKIDPSLMLFTMAGAIMHRVFVERQKTSDQFLEQVVELVMLGAAAMR
jgi:AcrR family transcriptional regulator